jgi:hypothetical protein
MDKRKAVSLSVVVTVVATSALWIVVGLAISEVRRMHEISNIVAPMGMLIDDLNKTAQAERHDVLRAKLQSLQEHWSAYLAGSERPDGFCAAICEIDDGAAESDVTPFVVTLPNGAQYRIVPDLVKLQSIPLFKPAQFEHAVRGAISLRSAEQPFPDIRELVFTHFSVRALDGPGQPPRYYKIGDYAEVEPIGSGT